MRRGAGRADRDRQDKVTHSLIHRLLVWPGHGRRMVRLDGGGAIYQDFPGSIFHY